MTQTQLIKNNILSKDIEIHLKLFKVRQDDVIIYDKNGCWLYNKQCRGYIPINNNINVPIAINVGIKKFLKKVDYWVIKDEFIMEGFNKNNKKIAEYILDIVPEDYKFSLPNEYPYILNIPPKFNRIENEYAYDIEGNSILVIEENPNFQGKKQKNINITLDIDGFRWNSTGELFIAISYSIIKFEGFYINIYHEH